MAWKSMCSTRTPAQSLLIYRRTNSAVGTPLAVDIAPGRCVGPQAFPIQRVLDNDSFAAAFNQLPLLAMGGSLPLQHFKAVPAHCRSGFGQRGTPRVHQQFGGVDEAVGFMQALVRMKAWRTASRIGARAMEPTFQRPVRRDGHSLSSHRAAGRISWPSPALLSRHCRMSWTAVKRERPAFWSILTDGGALSD